jgi:c-di-GMP-related signal transduction protein
MHSPGRGQSGARSEQASVSDSSHHKRSAAVVLYSRPGCHLCAEALTAIVSLRGEGYLFELREIDIDSDELLLHRMLERIPVVEVDGETVSELVLDEEALRARLDTVGARDRAGGREE